jgi:hypothetical protein
MKFQELVFLLVFGCFSIPAYSQDTFSIVAVDSVTGEVGSAGASCVDLFNKGFSDDSFLGELFPGVGAINSQAYYLPANQANARARMQAGDSPSEIIDWFKTMMLKEDLNSDNMELLPWSTEVLNLPGIPAPRPMTIKIMFWDPTMLSRVISCLVRRSWIVWKLASLEKKVISPAS